MIEWRSDITESDKPQPEDLVDPAPTLSPTGSPTDSLCVVCGYNLHGLVQNAPCPECSAAVAKTKERAFAAFSSNAQIRRISIFLWLIPIGALPIIVSATLTTIGFADRSPQPALSRQWVVRSLLALGLSVATWHALWFAFTLILKPRIEVIEPRGDSFRFVRKMMLALLATECIAALAFTFWAAGVTGVWSFATTMTPAILFTKYWGVPIILVAYLMQIPAVFMQADILSRFSYGLPQPELFVRSRRNAAAAMPLVCIAIIPGFGIVLLLIALIALMISSFRTLRVLRTLALHP